MTPKEMADDLILCENDPIHFIFNRVYTWDGEIQQKRLFASGYPLEYQNKMKQLILDIINCVRKGRQFVFKPDFHVLKSRQTGLTWLVSATIAYCFLYIENFSAILTSQSDNKLDNSNYESPNTFMGKINYIISSLPVYMQPAKEDILRSNKNYQYLAQKSSITADSGISPARSTQVSLHAGDEWAEQEADTMKLSSLREAVKGPNILFSTPCGMGNSFYTIYKNGKEHPEQSSFNFVQFHWKEKMSPEKWEAYKIMKIKDYNGDVGMFNRNLELSFEGLVVGTVTFSQFKDDNIIQFANIEKDKREALIKEISESNIGIILDFGYYAPALLVARNNIRNIVISSVLGIGKHPDLHTKMIITELSKWNINMSNKVKVFGDPSGVSKPREQTGMSSFDLYSKAFGEAIKQPTLRIYPTVNKMVEGIQSVNGQFYNKQLFILDTVEDVILGLHQAVYPVDEAGRVKDDEKYLLDHPQIDTIDCLRYACMLMIKPIKDEPFYVPGGIGSGNVNRQNEIDPDSDYANNYIYEDN